MARTAIPELHVGRGSMVGPLTVFPVWATAPEVHSVVCGTTALVEVSECEGSPVVGELVLTNSGVAPALLVEGELLEGGWQHRVLQHDIVLAPGDSLVAAVACVEAGRWHGDGTHRRRNRRASGSMRGALANPNAGERQSEVWARVSDFTATMGTSPTMSYLDQLEEYTGPGGILGDPLTGHSDLRETQDVDAAVRAAHAYRPLDGQRGVIVGAAGQPMLLELYPAWVALADAVPELLSGLLMDAFAAQTPVEPVPARRARRLVEGLDGRRASTTRGVDAGIGTPVGLSTGQVLVRGVTLDQEWLHLTAFNRHHSLIGVG